eukprot:364455-Chlamydomonas_euryale.AAC.2
MHTSKCGAMPFGAAPAARCSAVVRQVCQSSCYCPVPPRMFALHTSVDCQTACHQDIQQHVKQRSVQGDARVEGAVSCRSLPCRGIHLDTSLKCPASNNSKAIQLQQCLATITSLCICTSPRQHAALAVSDKERISSAASL